MKVRDRSESRHYEQRLQEIRKERNAETRQAERLSAMLAKKGCSGKAEKPPERAA
ncbi:MAG: hypothetical protein WAM48_17970 [Candidatus Sulfotelmatobacter sp.]